MGFAFAGEHQFRRNLSASGDVWRTHSNFARHLEEMLLQSARLRPVPWEETLDLFLCRVKGSIWKCRQLFKHSNRIGTECDQIT